MTDPTPVGDGKRIRIVVPESYKKVNESVWEELETYLFQGFLTATTIIAGKTFVFKTLNSHEVRNINFMYPTRGVTPDGGVQFKPIFIAHSIFMVDGVNTLYDRPRHINKLIRTLGKLPQKVCDKILDNLAALNQRAARLFSLSESYSYENRSRYKWLQTKGIPIHSPIASGIHGTDELGMNQCQQLWTAMNHILDRKDDMERDWQNAKFIGSCMAGKGIRTIDEKDKMRHEKERIEREDLKMSVLHAYLNRRSGVAEADKPKVQLPDGRWMEVVPGNQMDGKWRAETAEELAEQLESALAGEKDFHDLVIESKEKELRARAKAIESYQRSLFNGPSIPIPEENHPGSPGLHRATRIIGGKETADAYIKRMKELQIIQIGEAQRKISREGREEENFDKTDSVSGKSEDGQ